jgi:perosamine synthetase
VELIRFDASSCGFPGPGIPLLPHKLQWSAASSCSLASAISRKAPHFRHFSRGRYALGEAYRLAGLNSYSTLLAPAYHCVTMLDPALNLGADIQLYPLHKDLTPNLAELNNLLQVSKKPAKALLATHFFGLGQDFCLLRKWCDKHGIILIEDCSHVMFTEYFRSNGVGIYGKFVTASPYKFFSCEDGGLLYVSESGLLDGTVTKSPGLMDELRGIKRFIEKAQSATRVPFDISKVGVQLGKLAENSIIISDDQHVPYVKPSPHFSALETAKSSLCSSRWLVRISNTDQLISRRRKNFQRWAEAVAELPHCDALYTHLPADCTPYMFPLRIDYPELHFHRLKLLGFPIWRWDEMAFSNCKVAQDYRLHLLHLPVHQSLSDAQMDWMIAVLRETIRRPLEVKQ